LDEGLENGRGSETTLRAPAAGANSKNGSVIGAWPQDYVRIYEQLLAQSTAEVAA